MKIAVYSICKNEEKFVKSFLESVKDADLICIADTGSSDDTVELFKEVSKKLNINTKLDIKTIHISPWRFDDARNANLAMVPTDIDVCICLDLDEILVEGWREAIEKEWTKDTTRLRYFYTWNWNEDGTPGLTYWGDKIHSRIGYRWKMPCHETMRRDSRCGPEVQTWSNGLKIEHYADNTKSRSQYLPLLKIAVEEEPNNDREAHYYARELYFYRQYEKAIKEFERHLALPSATWNAERAASCRYMGDCYWELGQYDNAISAFERAIKEDPKAREGYVSLAQAYRYFKDWEKTKTMCEKALQCTEKGKSYISNQIAWSDWPNKMLQEAEKNIGSSLINSCEEA